MVWEDLRTLQQDQPPDIMLAAEGQSIPCHRVLLAATSHFFHDKFFTSSGPLEQKRLDIEDIDFDTLTSVVSFIYSGDIELTPENALKLCPASIKLTLPELTHMCENFFLEHTSSKDADVSFIIDINRMAKENCMKDIANKSWNVMLAEFQEVIESHAFKDMPEHDVVQYIKDDGLNVANEDPVFEAVVTWVKHDPENRKSRFESLLKHVTLPHCSLEFLRDKVKREPLMTSMGCYERVTGALCQHATALQLKPGTPRKGYTGKYSQPNSLIAVCADRYWVLKDGLPFWIRQRFSTAEKPEDSSACMAVDSIVFTGGILDGKPSKQCWKISLQTLQWVRLPDLNVARYYHSAVCVGHQIYVLGGRDCDNQPLQSVECLDEMTEEWCMTCDMPLQIYSHTAVNYNNHIYVFGGITTNFDLSSNTFMLDVVSKTWSRKTDLPQECTGGFSFPYKNKIYVHGGTSNYFIIYDPHMDQWQTLPSGGVWYSGCSVALTNRILLYSYSDTRYSVSMTIEEYNPDTDAWSTREQEFPKHVPYPVGLFAVHLSNRALSFLKQKLPRQTMVGDNDDVVSSIHTLYDNA